MINLSPLPEEIASLGPLAYVDDVRREEIGRLPLPQRNSALKTIEREVAKERTAASKKPKQPPAYRPMTEMERILIGKLQNVTYLPGSPHKKFAHDIASATQITEAQASYIKGLAHKYRRQIG